MIQSQAVTALSMIHDFSFEQSGLNIIPGFFDAQQLQALNAELDMLFSKVSSNGNLFSAYLNPGYYTLPLPTISIRSVNLLELAIQVRDVFFQCMPSLKAMNYKLTAISIFSEAKNPKSLFWHTDNRKGMLRAQICLQGGQHDSGAFWYMVGTHNRDYYVNHKLSAAQIKQLADKIYQCSAEPGSLICFDANGFHAKAPCIKTRRTIFFEIQPADTDFVKSHIYLSSADLSATVMQNIDFFVNHQPRDQFLHGGDEKLFVESPLPFSCLFSVMIRALKYQFKVTAYRIFPLFLRKWVKKIFLIN